MRNTAIVMFLFFCFYLFGGNSCVRANMARQISVTEGFQNPPQPGGVLAANTSELQQRSSGEDKFVLLCMDDEEEEPSGRKYTLLSKYVPAFFHAITSRQDGNSEANIFSLQCHPRSPGSPKYIVQRALRL